MFRTVFIVLSWTIMDCMAVLYILSFKLDTHIEVTVVSSYTTYFVITTIGDVDLQEKLR